MLKAGSRSISFRHGETIGTAPSAIRRKISLNATGPLASRAQRPALGGGAGGARRRARLRLKPVAAASETWKSFGSHAPRAECLPHRRAAARGDYGSWEGQLWHEMPISMPMPTPRAWPMPGMATAGGESYRMVAERVGSWLADLAETPCGRHGASVAPCAPWCWLACGRDQCGSTAARPHTGPRRQRVRWL